MPSNASGTHTHPMPTIPIGTRVASLNGDDFVGTVIGHYERLDGRKGVVVQQDGARVVHAYGENRVEVINAK